MLSNILLVLGALGILALVDFFMDDSQRDRLRSKAEDAWNIVDELNKKPRFEVLRHPVVQRWLPRAAATISFLVSCIIYGRSLMLLEVVLFVMVALLLFFSFVGPFVVKRDATFQIVLRAWIVVSVFGSIILRSTDT